MKAVVDLSPYALDRRAVTSQYYLTEEQREKANFNQKKIIYDFQQKESQLKDKKQIIETIHTFVIKSYPSLDPFKQAWENYHKSAQEQTIEKKKKLLKDAQQALEKNDANDVKEYLTYYRDYFELSLAVAQLDIYLKDLNLVDLQAVNYRQRVQAFRAALGRAHVLLLEIKQSASKDYIHSNPLIRAWNHWIDARHYHRWAKRHDKTQLNLQQMIKILEKQDDFDIAKKTKDIIESECFIMQTLTDAYDQIFRLSTDYRCCVKYETRVPDQQIDLHDFNSGYIRVITETTNKLYYVNKREHICQIVEGIGISLEKFDQALLSKPTSNPRWLSLSELEAIKRETGHEPTDKVHMLFQWKMANKMLKINDLCNKFNGSGHSSLRHIASVFMLLTAIVVIVAATGLGMYLGGGTATALVLTALTTIQLYPSLVVLAAAAGCSIALVTPLALGVGGVVTSMVSGSIAFGFWNLGQDKNPISRGARQAAALFLEEMISQHEADTEYKPISTP